MAAPDFTRVAETIDAAIGAGAFPGAVIVVAKGGELLHHSAHGARLLEPVRTPMGPDTVFDLASLTKPLATTLALMLLVRDGRLRLDDRVARFLPNFGVYGKTPLTVRQLLAHCSGLPAWRPYWKEIARLGKHGRPNFVASNGARDMMLELIHRERLEYPPGTKSVYSDLGFMLLGEIVELLSHTTLDRFCRDRIFRPLGLQSTGFVDLQRLRMQKVVPIADKIAPTERCPWRQKVLCGEVHDDNAYAAGGVVGHSGLFASALDVHRLMQRLRACHLGEDDLVPAAIMREFWRVDASVPESTWALGWDTPSATGSSAGSRVSARAVGHLGFTGTSLWYDLQRDAWVIFLTNRVHPNRNNDRIREVRPRVHDAVWEVLET